MIKNSTVKLYTETPGAHGVFDTVTKTARTVCCTEKSIGLQMKNEANAMGMAPEIRLNLAHEFSYHGEKLAEYKGVMYKVVHTYPIEKYDGIDLLLERLEGNANV